MACEEINCSPMSLAQVQRRTDDKEVRMLGPAGPLRRIRVRPQMDIKCLPNRPLRFLSVTGAGHDVQLGIDHAVTHRRPPPERSGRIVGEGARSRVGRTADGQPDRGPGRCRQR
ncbi:hypothetical protein HEK616_42170 [Streptomyces nigrescens]|uniref:Transposase n=1 Tax=Streptomyces nigrescens TaxID=1920 RepID=A0ABM7ZWJ3_STRNI|nr:hypothetical protein HEK616_42170 [Streptomyces nigrescens]